jgi:catechol O-methyltransferase
MSFAYRSSFNIQFNDGRELRLLEFVFSHPNLAKIRNSPADVIEAIDQYGRTEKYLMNIGYHKANIVTDIIVARKPKTAVELGGYVGYSAIKFGDAVRSCGGKEYISIEENPIFAAVSSLLIQLAGLQDVVRVVVGSSDEVLRRLHSDGELKQIDLLFLDHLKPLYTRDLRLCESMGLVRFGTMVVADNVMRPGIPDYLRYVKASTSQRVLWAKENSDSGGSYGNPGLLYQSVTKNSFQMTGLSVSNTNHFH